MKITHYGFNYTHIGDYNKPRAWVPVSYKDDKPVLYEKNLNGLILKTETLQSRLDRLALDYGVCRIWIKYADDSTKCVYWYQQANKKVDTV